MIGLGGSLTSGVPESKYSANFDGTDEYIDIGQTFQSVFRGDYSISFWVKPDDGRQSGRYIFGADNDTNDNQSFSDEIYFEMQSDGKPRFVIKSNSDTGIWSTHNGGGFAFADGAASSWTHFVITVDLQSSGNTIVKIYVNGVDKTNDEDSGMASANHDDYTSNLNLVLGAKNTEGVIGGFYNGGLDEFAIFNTVLGTDEPLAIYNNTSPLNLSFNQGNYVSSSALQVYYRMGDGLFDDKANGIIHDQDNPGFGSNLVTWDGSTTSDWNKTQGANTTLSANNGNLRASANGSGAYGTSRSFTTVVDAVYKVEANINVDNASGGAGNLRASNQQNLGDSAGMLVTLSQSTGFSVSYFTATATTTHIGVIDTGSDSSDYMEIESISVKKINGNPGVTSGGVTFLSDTP